MRRLHRQSAWLVVVSLALCGCSATTSRRADSQADFAQTNLAASTGLAVDRLLGSMSPPLAPETTVVVASFADLNDLSVSTKLGRLIAEQTAEHLIQRGYRVPEARLTDTLYIRNEGEFMLSREVEELKLAASFGAGVVVTGTTSSVDGVTYVNFRLIRYVDGIALAAADMQLPDRTLGR